MRPRILKSSDTSEGTKSQICHYRIFNPNPHRDVLLNIHGKTSDVDIGVYYQRDVVPDKDQEIIELEAPEDENDDANYHSTRHRDQMRKVGYVQTHFSEIESNNIKVSREEILSNGKFFNTDDIAPNSGRYETFEIKVPKFEHSIADNMTKLNHTSFVLQQYEFTGVDLMEIMIVARDDASSYEIGVELSLFESRTNDWFDEYLPIFFAVLIFGLVTYSLFLF